MGLSVFELIVFLGDISILIDGRGTYLLLLQIINKAIEPNNKTAIKSTLNVNPLARNFSTSTNVFVFPFAKRLI